MRFLRLKVEKLRGIDRAEVELGPGLNVLYGPNDIGKSTLACAIRSALLLPCSSQEGADLVPWSSDHTPLVELTFATGPDAHHRVTKTFGAGSRGSAKLERSRDGARFDVAATARQVDEKLRELLGWGIPPPGGKGGPRGLPEAFLSHVLLAEQTDVDRVLRESLESDPSDSGRQKLTVALQALATDRRVKAVLDEAQAKVDEFFSETGKRRRAKDSPFFAAAEAIKALRADLDAIEARKKDSEQAEARIRELTIRAQTAADAVESARATLATVEAAWAQARAARAAEEAHADAVRELAAVDEEHARIAAKAKEIVAFSTELAKRLSEKKQADDALKDAEGKLALAQEAERRESSAEAAAARALKQAQAEKRRAELEGEARDRAARRALAEAATRAVAEHEKLAASASTMRADRDNAARAITAAEKVEAEAQLQARQIDRLVRYAEWIDVDRRRQSAARAGAELARLAERAAEDRAAAASLRAGLLSSLPSAGEIKAIEALERELDRARAAMSGALSVTVRPKAKVSVEARADGKAVKIAAKGTTFDATQSVHLAVADVLDVEIVSGDRAARQAVAELEDRWAHEAKPKLGDHPDAAALRDARQAHDRAFVEAETLEARATAAEQALAALEADADELESLTARASELERAIEDRATIAALHTKLGPSPAASIAAMRKQVSAEAHQAAEKKHAARAKLERLDGQLAQLEASVQTAEVARAEALERAGGEPRAIARALDEEAERAAAESKRLAAELSALSSSASGALDRARKAVAEAEAAVAARRSARAAAESEVSKQQSRIDVAQGEHKTLAAQQRDRAPYAAKVTEAAARRVPIDPALDERAVDDARAALRAAERALAEQQQELSRAEGALAQVGGATVADRYAELLAALEAAEARQKLIDVDADAWRMLRDALKENESAGAAHVGKVLSEQVTTEFRDLTGARYGALALGPTLETHGIEGGGEQRDVAVLSVGAREQLATLLRLAIARSLGSAIVLDDHLVQTDLARLSWFVDAMRKASEHIQVIVLTCRRRDYEAAEPVEGVRWIDLDRSIRRFSGGPPVPPPNAAFHVLLAHALGELEMEPAEFARGINAGSRTVQSWLEGAALPAGPVRATVIAALATGAPDTSYRARAADALR